MEFRFGHALYIGSLLVALGAGIALLLWKQLDMFFEWGLWKRIGPRRARLLWAIVCFYFFVEGVIMLFRHWDKVSAMGRIHLH